jgi:hypothetical protein
MANAAIEGAALILAFTAGVTHAPPFMLGLLVVLYGVYYLYSRKARLGAMPILARASLVGVAGAIMVGCFGIGWVMRFLVSSG